MGSSVRRLMPIFASAAMAVGPALIMAGCGGSGGGGGGGSTAAGATAGNMDGLAFGPEESVIVEAPGGSTAVSQFQLIVDSYSASSGKVLDVTRQAMLTSSDDTVARVGADGLIEALSPGMATITANFGGIQITKDIEVVASVGSATFTQVKVYPGSRVLDSVSVSGGVTQDQQLVVVGIDQDGKAHDLTRTLPIVLSDWDPNNPNQPAQLPISTAATLSPNGLLTGSVEGEDVLVQVEIVNGPSGAAHIHLGPGNAKPITGAVFSPGSLAGSSNPIDQAVLQGLQAKGVSPAPASSDGEFLRRLYSDALGRLPSAAEAEAFQANTASDKRDAEVDRVVAMPEFARHWASRLGEWFVIPDTTFDTWAETQLAADTSLVSIVADLAAGNGQGGTLFDAQHDTAAKKVSILLLAGTGMAAECAGCHDHPFTGPNDNPRWIQADRYPLDAFFAATNDEAIPMDKAGNRTGNNGQPFQPGFTALDPTKTVASTLTTPLAQRRQEFATLFTGTAFFRRGFAHRIWSEVCQPLLDPNQFIAKNLNTMAAPQVLTALSGQFESAGGSLKTFLSGVFKSKVYQLSSEVSDLANDPLLARRVLTRQQSEVCASLALNLTGAGPNNMGFFNSTFGFPLSRLTIGERSAAINMSQSLVFQNSPVVHAGLTAQNGVPGQLAASVAAGTMTMQQAVGQLWLAAYSRNPAADEVTDAMATIQAAGTPAEGLQDVATALMASIEAAAN